MVRGTLDKLKEPKFNYFKQKSFKRRILGNIYFQHKWWQLHQFHDIQRLRIELYDLQGSINHSLYFLERIHLSWIQLHTQDIYSENQYDPWIKILSIYILPAIHKTSKTAPAVQEFLNSLILFLKSMSERVRSDIKRLFYWMKQFDNFNMSVLILNHITIYMKIKTLFQNDNDVLNRKKTWNYYWGRDSMNRYFIDRRPLPARDHVLSIKDGPFLRIKIS